MKRYSAFACALLSICYSLTSASGPAQARKNNEGAAAPAPAQAQAQQAAARAQMAQARSQQEQSIRNQQAEARQVQQQQLRAQEESRQNQEHALLAQEEQARQSQQQAIKAQQAEARQAQESMKAQQQQARQAQEETQRAQQAETRQAQQESRNEAKAQAAQAQQERKAEANQARQSNVERGGEFRGRENTGVASAPPPGFSGNAEAGGNESRRMENGSFGVNNRAVEPRAIEERKVPLQTAVSMPVLDAGATAQQRQHFQKVQTNLQDHLYAVPLRQAPANMLNLENAQRGEYFNNYRAMVDNRQLYINRENTLCNVVAANEWPYWYQAEPNYQFCNSFTLGSSIQCGLDWLRWGWHPYYGPQPDGFVCANDYAPTPWIYYPAYGLWRQPGVLGWAPGGPPYDYSGPISVEVLEPRTVNVRDPYTGWNSARTINVVYMYNAFFYPDYDRWGYRNRHNYFIWVNV